MRILFLIALIFSCSKLKACDGCNISTGFINIDPVSYASLRHRNVNYEGTEIPFFRHTGSGGELSENYLNHEFVAKYFVVKNLFLQSLISLKQTKVSSHDINKTINGLSDPIILVGYQNFEIFKKWQFNYSFFGGCDIGIGQYDNSLGEEYSPSSETSDLMLGSELLARFMKWSIISKINYKIGSENKLGYRFGQTINTSLFTGYYHNRGNLTLIPLIGLSMESDFSDYDNKRSVKFSSSDVLFSDFGLNLMIGNKFIVGAKYKIPVFKNVSGWSELKLAAFEFEISYVLDN